MVQILELFGGIGSPRCALRNLNIPTKAIDYVEINEKAVRSYNSMFRDELEYKTQTVVGWNVWYGLLQDLPYEQANLAIQKYMTSERFPPTIADIRTKATEIIAPVEESMSELQAWALVQRALRNSGYNSEEEFAKLPEACQRAVGTAANLKEWALMDSDQVATIEQSHFIRNYRTSVQRMKEEARLPENVRMLIADMGKKHAALMEKAVDPQIEMQKIEVPEEKTEPPSGMSNETRKRLDEMYEKFGRK